MSEEVTPEIREKFNDWWMAQTSIGDPARLPNPTFKAFIAGYRAALEPPKSVDLEPIHYCWRCKYDDEDEIAIGKVTNPPDSEIHLCKRHFDLGLLAGWMPVLYKNLPPKEPS